MPLIETGPFSEGDRDFYAALGWAVAQWQGLEHALERLAGLVEHGDPEAVRRSGTATAAELRARIEVVDRGLSSSGDDDARALWQRLRPRLERQVGVRDELLCATVSRTDAIASGDGYPLHLCPEPGVVEAIEGAGRRRPPRYNTRQILERGRGYNRSALDLGDLADRIAAPPEP